MFATWSRAQKWGAALGAAVVVVVVIVLAVVLTRGGDSDQTTHRGAIATDGKPCAPIGLDLLKAGGSAVDVAVGTLLCEGLASAQSMGLGGGFLMTIYDRVNKKSYTMNAREMAPLAASRDMYGNNETLALRGGLAFAVPAELKGYWALHQKFGRLPWRDLVEPSIKLCEEGVAITQYVANSIQSEASLIMASSMREILLDEKTGQLKKKGDLIKRPRLAQTLRVIAQEGVDALYNGSLTDAFIEDINKIGGIITKEDLLAYEARFETPTTAELPGGLRLVSTQPPGSGPLVSHFLQLAADYVTAPLDAHQYHRMVEALKFTYGARTLLGDLHYEASAAALCKELVDQNYADEIRSKINETRTSSDPEYYGANFSTSAGRGTAHVAVVTPEMAVSVTSTVNTIYGSMWVSPSTGIIMNNEMDDFSLPGVPSVYGLPPSPANYIVPKKRPLSSMAPSVILDAAGDVVLVIGASGGTRITSAIGQVALKHLYLGMSLKDAVEQKRVHHQLGPMRLQLEKGFPQDLADALKAYGHTESELSVTASSVMAIQVNGNHFNPVSDLRREGVTGLL